jgi:hypothetical protein
VARRSWDVGDGQGELAVWDQVGAEDDYGATGERGRRLLAAHGHQ